jgi:hypothetical protein
LQLSSWRLLLLLLGRVASSLLILLLGIVF